MNVSLPGQTAISNMYLKLDMVQVIFCIKAPYTINFIVNFSILYEVIDHVWAVLMQKSFIKPLTSIILSQ